MSIESWNERASSWIVGCGLFVLAATMAVVAAAVGGGIVKLLLYGNPQLM